MSVRWQSPANWTLRARLIVSVLALLLVACAGIGAFAAVTIKHQLTSQLDTQLSGAGQAFAAGGPGGGRFRDQSRFPPGSPASSVKLVNVGGIEAGYLLGQDGTGTALAPDLTQQLQGIPADGHLHSVELNGLGNYRAVASADQVLAFPTKAVTDTIRSVTLAIAGLSIIALILAGVVGAFIVRLALRPLQRVTATASRVAELDLDQGEVALAERVPAPNPHTEVGQVGVALNRMLENVTDALNARHRSEMRVRQFVADASHELRTPLASIRGYAELTRRSRQLAPPDISHAMSRVESEASRMTTLVEDLLLLARLDAGRPLERADVDLTALAVDAVSDAHAAGPEHHWDLGLPDEPVVVQGDGARLHQVVANLLANARTHTPPGTRVKLSLSRAGDYAMLSIRDDGPGISAELMPDIFQRFSRGEASRSRAAGSTGLGLAIVAAVVAAHGGRIDVSSLPGNTLFTVTLPLHRERQDRSQSPASLASNAF